MAFKTFLKNLNVHTCACIPALVSKHPSGWTILSIFNEVGGIATNRCVLVKQAKVFVDTCFHGMEVGI